MKEIAGPRPPWKGRRVVLGVTGGIAAYKSVQLARDLTLLGAEVDVLPTDAASRFVRPLTFEAVTGRPVLTELFSVEGAARHIRLGEEADVVCVAPATADFMARAAQGRADDLLTTTLLATEAPVLICPAMNHRMYRHPQTAANAAHLRDALGYRIVGPAVGRLAHGEGEGEGRMVEPDEILEWIGRALGRDAALHGKEVLVTAGPTREALDPVRYVGNRSSGRMGFALARAAWRGGASVTLVTGPSSLDDPPGVVVTRVETAREMLEAVRKVVAGADVVIFAAAVADYRPSDPAPEKLKRERIGAGTAIELVANPDVAGETRDLRRGALTVGFALESEDLVVNARKKLEQKGFDLIVANAVGLEDAGFDVETNRVTLLGVDGEPEELPLMSKDEVAEEILARVSALLAGGPS